MIFGISSLGIGTAFLIIMLGELWGCALDRECPIWAALSRCEFSYPSAEWHGSPLLSQPVLNKKRGARGSPAQKRQRRYLLSETRRIMN